MAVKRCQVCGQAFDPDRDGWECLVAFRGRHIPTDRPGTIYVLCLGKPMVLDESDVGHVSPTTHYVGWTGQRPPGRRVAQHGAPPGSVAALTPGTAEDEQKLKRDGTCPRCGVALAPECLGAPRSP